MKNEVYESDSRENLIVVVVISAIMLLILGSLSMFCMVSISNTEKISDCIPKIVSCGFVFLGIIIFSALALIAANLLFKTEKFLIKTASSKDVVDKHIDEKYLQFLKEQNLRDLVKEEITNQRDLIKKFCDTLVEL